MAPGHLRTGRAPPQTGRATSPEEHLHTGRAPPSRWRRSASWHLVDAAILDGASAPGMEPAKGARCLMRHPRARILAGTTGMAVRRLNQARELDPSRCLPPIAGQPSCLITEGQTMSRCRQRRACSPSLLLDLLQMAQASPLFHPCQNLSSLARDTTGRSD